MHLAIPPMRQCCPHRTFVSLAVGFSQFQAWTKCTQETGQKRALPGLLWIDLSLLAELFGSLTAVRVVLHGLRSSRLVDHRLGGETTGGRGDLSSAWRIHGSSARPAAKSTGIRTESA